MLRLKAQTSGKVTVNRLLIHQYGDGTTAKISSPPTERPSWSDQRERAVTVLDWVMAKLLIPWVHTLSNLPDSLLWLKQVTGMPWTQVCGSCDRESPWLDAGLVHAACALPRANEDSRPRPQNSRRLDDSFLPSVRHLPGSLS